MTPTLWRSGDGVDPALLEYTTAEDRPWDRRLLAWDVVGSLGHVEGLRASGLLDDAERDALVGGLRAIHAEVVAGTLVPGPGHEDVHTAVETWLSERLPEAGLRLHTGRSRNDQVACDVRLWLKDALLGLHAAAAEAAEALLEWGEPRAGALWPGYTHLRAAMPSSAGFWAAALGEGLVDTLEALPAVWASVDRSPLGSAAGYGTPLPLDREAAARALGFASVEHAPGAVQNGRGKVEAAVLFWCAQAGHEVARLAADVILFGAEPFGFLRLPADLSTGSSLMPQKRNPDVFELTRARVAAVEGDLATVLRLRAGLTSGYHRDFQMLKEPTMRGVERTAAALSMAARAVPRLEVDEARAAAALDGGVLATDEALRRAAAGTPFRTAYREVADEVARGEPVPPLDAAGILARRIGPGGLGDLDLGAPRRRLADARAWAGVQRHAFDAAVDRLLGRAEP